MHLTSSQMATMKKPKIKSAGEDEEKLERLCPLVRTGSGVAIVEDSMVIPQNFKNRVTI